MRLHQHLVSLILVQMNEETAEGHRPIAHASRSINADSNRRCAQTEPVRGQSDLLDENLYFNDKARATGFVGATSEVQWLRAVAAAHSQRIDERVGEGPTQLALFQRTNEGTGMYNYWTDSDDAIIETDVDRYELPAQETAEDLLSCYLSKVHDSFPILIRETFEPKFRRYFSALRNEHAPPLTRSWQAVLNTVFAISAYHFTLANADKRADDGDHLVYEARARAFHLDDATMTSDLDVPQVKSLGLLAFYWMSLGQINR
jgi:hypothetical protein